MEYLLYKALSNMVSCEELKEHVILHHLYALCGNKSFPLTCFASVSLYNVQVGAETLPGFFGEQGHEGIHFRGTKRFKSEGNMGKGPYI